MFALLVAFAAIQQLEHRLHISQTLYDADTAQGHVHAFMSMDAYVECARRPLHSHRPCPAATTKGSTCEFLARWAFTRLDRFDQVGSFEQPAGSDPAHCDVSHLTRSTAQDDMLSSFINKDNHPISLASPASCERMSRTIQCE